MWSSGLLACLSKRFCPVIVPSSQLVVPCSHINHCIRDTIRTTVGSDNGSFQSVISLHTTTGAGAWLCCLASKGVRLLLSVQLPYIHIPYISHQVCMLQLRVINQSRQRVTVKIAPPLWSIWLWGTTTKWTHSQSKGRKGLKKDKREEPTWEKRI